MNLKHFVLALLTAVLAAAGIVGAIAMIAFTAVNLCGLDGASWSNLGLPAILLGCSVIGLIGLDRLEE